MFSEKVDIARLLVTELVTNAVSHGSGSVILAVARDGEGLRIEVQDESPDMPFIVEESRSLMEGGMGLRLVAAFASRWGVEPRSEGKPGKWVWFALA
jgi:anti-sigma regulatory factor (Ser/Thr protein kinase)